MSKQGKIILIISVLLLSKLTYSSVQISFTEFAYVSSQKDDTLKYKREGKIIIEWLDPKENIKTKHGFIRIKARVVTNLKPELNLMVNKLIIADSPESVTKSEGLGYIYTYYIRLHDEITVIKFRVLDPVDKSYIFSKERVIEYEPK